MSEHPELSDDRRPKHQLETGLLGRPKHGKQRVRDLAAQQSEAAADSPDQPLDNSEDEEQIK
jgi:hypothetical protein